MAKKPARKPAAPYASETLAVSRRMVAPGLLHEELSVIHDLSWRYRNLQSQLAHYDRRTGEPIAREAERLRREAERLIEQLPDAELRANLARELYK